MTETIVNIDFLRSGLEFFPENEQLTKKKPENEKDVKSQNSKLNAFHEKMLEAAKKAIEQGYVPKSPQNSRNNKPFFQTSDPISIPSGAGYGSGSASLPNSFHTTSNLASASASSSVSSLVGSPNTIVNLEFLRSGKEFQEIKSEKKSKENNDGHDGDDNIRPRSRSCNQRLNEFHNKMLAAVQSAQQEGLLKPKQASPKSQHTNSAPNSPAQSANSIIDVEMLRRGLFSPPNPALSDENTHIPPESGSVSKMLNKFHDQMLLSGTGKK